MRKRSIWTLILVVVTLLEVGVLGYHTVTAREAAAAGEALPAAQEASAQRQRPPSGNSSEAAQQYYDYIFAHYLRESGKLRTNILWTGPFWIAVWAAVMILFFFFYTDAFQEVHRERGELYGAASFAGSILERIGTIAFFSKLIWTGITLWGAYYIVIHILWGQVY